MSVSMTAFIERRAARVSLFDRSVTLALVTGRVGDLRRADGQVP